jgi:hypothetical protein
MGTAFAFTMGRGVKEGGDFGRSVSSHLYSTLLPVHMQGGVLFQAKQDIPAIHEYDMHVAVVTARTHNIPTSGLPSSSYAPYLPTETQQEEQHARMGNVRRLGCCNETKQRWEGHDAVDEWSSAALPSEHLQGGRNGRGKCVLALYHCNTLAQATGQEGVEEIDQAVRFTDHTERYSHTTTYCPTTVDVW